MRGLRARLWRLAGVDGIRVSHTERLVAAVGGTLGLMAVLAVSEVLLGPGAGAIGVVASMGASAVLLFAVPHGPLSQPWAVLGGHGVSALTGVACALAFPDPLLAGPLAVGLSIGAMHYLRCIHPPGGATALTAVLGGAGVQALGFGFVLAPVLLNAAILVAMAVAVNALFPWRRYPAALMLAPAVTEPDNGDGPPRLERADLDWAMEQLDAWIDVSEQDLVRIYDLAYRHARDHHLAPSALSLRGCYSNGRFGEAWQVRKVVDLREGRVAYRVVAGEGRGESGTSTREAFARWARYPVERHENYWRRATLTPADA